MKLIIDRFKENKKFYIVEFFTDTLESIYKFNIMEYNNYFPDHQMRYAIYSFRNVIVEYLLKEELKEIDYLLTNSVDNKFLFLNMNNDKVKEYFEIDELFKLRIKYSKHPTKLIELGVRLFE